MIDEDIEFRLREEQEPLGLADQISYVHVLYMGLLFVAVPSADVCTSPGRFGAVLSGHCAAAFVSSFQLYWLDYFVGILPS